MKQEERLHHSTQRMRSMYYKDIQKTIDKISDFDKQQQAKGYRTQIDNKFVDILILNALIHRYTD